MKNRKVFAYVLAVLLLVAPICMAGCSLSDLFGPKEGIKLHTAFKTEYEVGEGIDLTNGKIEYTDEEGNSTVVVITVNMVSGFNTQTPGNRQMIITYNDKTLLVDYTVYKIYDIEVGALYYHNPSQMRAVQNTITGENEDPGLYYDYVKFYSTTSVDFAFSSTAPQNAGDDIFFSPSDCTSSVENHVKTYSWTMELTGAEIEVIVLSDTTIRFKVNSEAENVMNFQIDLVKYVAQ